MPWKNCCLKDERWRFVQEWMRGKKPLAEQCRQWSISRKTGNKWIRRFKELGRRGLADREHRARQVHNRPTAVWLGRIKHCRALYPFFGAPKLRWVLGKRFGRKGRPSEAAISRWLQRWGLSRKRQRARHKGPVLERPKLTVPQQPNEVWTVDYKGWFRTGDRTRIDPLTVRDLASLFVLAVDLQVKANLAKARRAFERIFRQYGLPAVIRSDNGAPFGSSGALGLTRLSAWWVKLGIRVEFIAPGRPDQNGAHEQMHRVYKDETLQPPAPTLRAQKLRTRRWLQRYNEERPHETLDMRTPAELYRASRRRKPSHLAAWAYPAGWSSRLVKGKGMISLNGCGRYIGEAFECERIGLKPSRPGVWQVYYGPLWVGELWDNESSGIRAGWLRKKAQRRPS